ncbi:MAG: hypothetical protein IPH62_19800 [Ignavibacteriae bacterium]|nr:hypothetical protein [Ignavibacteriota bacterium]
MKIEFCNILFENEKEYLLDIEDYISSSQNWINFDFEKIIEITNITREILLQEFGLYSEDINGKIKIPINKERKILDVVYEILKQKGSPMHLDDIFLEFKSIMPNHKYIDCGQLRPFLQRHELISFRNRNSTYTLKEWKHIRSGTIRDAIIEFLLKNNLPQTVNEITKYVIKHFPKTTKASVRTSMQIDTLKRFVFFGNNLFGLASKMYPTEFEKKDLINKLFKNFEQRLNDFEKFILENKHFPFSSSEDLEEESLCRWWYRIINGKQQISLNQQKEVERIKNKYAEYEIDINNYKWNLNYNKLKHFLQENQNISHALGNDHFLYGWFKRAKKDFHNYNLTDDQRHKFIDLIKLI